ncbi:50S ribosomal protein L1 [Candidatus Woesearchaeota archaeon]|jgi:large subunit ribosomal protein L1|nr:50S ribosomal protein L1 [Candidatus Woesearchaeota archaeon]|tara:strand:- start:2368 stop:3015 length:648 start_codon:yes stop_codon:yes gene_type:complete
MEQGKVIETLKKMRNKKRNFSQAVDLVVSFKDLDLKKPEHQVDFFITLQNSPGKKAKIAALVAQELAAEAKNVCDEVVLQDDFPKYAKDKKILKKLVREHAYFIGQANIMPKIATTFGRFLGPKGKMPNPKAGCIVPPKASLKPLYEKLQNTVHVQAKTAPVVHCRLGNEKMSDEELAQNFASVYDQLLASLPNGEANVRAVFLKLTMGKPEKLK